MEKRLRGKKVDDGGGGRGVRRCHAGRRICCITGLERDSVVVSWWEWRREVSNSPMIQVVSSLD